MKTGIHQPNFIPWLGYFRKIALSDNFVFFDNVQMPGGKSFVSRGAVKTAQGRQWLTVPVRDKMTAPISHVRILDDRWKRKHLGTLRGAYGKSPWKSLIDDLIEPIMVGDHDGLADLNIALIKAIAARLELNATNFLRASDMQLAEDGADSITGILLKTDTTTYLTGSGAGTRRHLDVDGLRQQGIETEFVADDFAEYQQLHGPFEAGLSILDALLNLGPEDTRKIIDGA
jgi:hypothetical protein